MVTTGNNYPWVHFRLKEETYGISSANVESMVYLDDTVTVPQVPDYIRGVMNVRGKVIQCIDLRKMLGMHSLTGEIAEFESMMDQRKNDHIRWLAELEASVKEKRDFSLTTDPHACAFGKWYDSFSTDNVVLKSLLTRFDAPHKKIHRIANSVKTLEKEHRFDEAAELIGRTRQKELCMMIELFDSVKKAYAHSRKEILIILEQMHQTIGLIVDEVISVETIPMESIDTVGVSTDLPNMKIGKHRRDSALTILLDTSMF